MSTQINKRFIQLSFKFKENTISAAICVSLIAVCPEAMASTDELKTVADGVFGLATGSGMKIALGAASLFSIVVGLTSNALLKPAFAVAGVAGTTPLIMNWIDTKYTLLI